jgi:hypothetical protein
MKDRVFEYVVVWKDPNNESALSEVIIDRTTIVAQDEELALMRISRAISEDRLAGAKIHIRPF